MPQSTSDITGKILLKKEELHEHHEEHQAERAAKYEVPVSDKPAFARLTKADLFRFIGLLAFIVLIIIACVLAAPVISQLTTEGGVENLIEQATSAGASGVLVLLGFQFLQIVVAVIPGEVVQLVAGMMYGTWGGAAIILVGCVLSSSFIFVVVRHLGEPFVRAMVPEKWMGKLERFESSEKFDLVIFVLFLIPGLPKDIFTYLVPLTRMRMRNFVILSNVGRIPGVLMSTFAANGLIQGNYLQSIVMFVVLAVIAIVAFFLCEKLLVKKPKAEAAPEGSSPASDADAAPEAADASEAATPEAATD